MAQRSFGGRVVVVTGAAGGIGRAIAERFALERARLVLLDVDEVGLSTSKELLLGKGVEVLALACDITRAEDNERAARAILDRFGCVDVLVNNAGVVHRSSFRDTDVDVFRRVMEVNYFGSLSVTKALLEPLIAAQGLIIVVSSIAGLSPLYGRSGYSASKHALHGLFESLRAELSDDRVEVLMVCPSFTRTPFEQRALGASGERVERGRSRVGTEASPDDVADAVVRAARRRQRLLVLSPVGKLAVWLARLAPALYERSMVKALREELGGG
ncbi:MAG: SDR family oxidoreductase [Myxococcales bacterium]|nr:SDR family oxidoreductase [Sorangiineae bacterium PRO1]MCL4749226.1 SDR family oxidoreductase [Myxococcales bacterium]